MHLADGLSELRILSVDDDEVDLYILRRTLERAGYRRVQTTTDPSHVPALFVETEPDLVVLDLHMPGIDAFELLERLVPIAGGRSGIPFLVLSADDTEEVKRRALETGARDFLTKPFDPTELLLRVRNLLKVQQLHTRLREHNASLERQVVDRTRELEQARQEMLARLVLAADYGDDANQEHALRIGRACGQLALAVGLANWQLELVERAAPLHDIGKIGIPDAILLKPGRLTDAEFAQVRTHTTIGAGILSGSDSQHLSLAERIALTHHERWDGEGYPRGLRGEQIPLAGRIVAVASVFDALTHERPYKQAWPVEEAVAEIVSQRGRQFDPGVVDAFATLDHAALLSRTEHVKPAVDVSRRLPEARLAGLL
jgi:putative two-component system response regulator